MKKYLFIGGAGFIGSNLIKCLLQYGRFEIHVAEPFFANLQRLNVEDVVIHRVSINDIQAIRTLIVTNHIDVVVHLVSIIVPGSTYDDFISEFTNVTFPTVRLMEICAENKVKFVYFSSGGTIYGNRKELEKSGFQETEDMAPISYYGWSKQMMENGILFMHRTQGLEYIIIRPSNPYGKGQDIYGKQGLIAVALGKVLNHEPITVFGDGSAIRDYIYISDLVEAVCQILCLEDARNMTLNIGSGIGYSINEVLDIISGVVNEELDIKYIESRKSDVSSIILNIEKLKTLIDFSPRTLEEGVKEFYSYLQNEQ